MTTAARPSWVRLNIDIFENPKFLHLQEQGQHRAVLVWLQCLMYCARHLTDGWVPESIPKRCGFRAKDMQVLVDSGLIHRMEMDENRGWLIHDYFAYQPSKQHWIDVSEKRRKAARSRWEDT